MRLRVIFFCSFCCCCASAVHSQQPGDHWAPDSEAHDHKPCWYGRGLTWPQCTVNTGAATCLHAPGAMDFPEFGRERTKGMETGSLPSPFGMRRLEAIYLVLAEGARKANPELAGWSQALVSTHLRSIPWLRRGWSWWNRQPPIPLRARFNLLWRQRAKARLQWESAGGRARHSELISSAEVAVSGMATRRTNFWAELSNLLVFCLFALTSQVPGKQKDKDILRIHSLILVSWGFFSFVFLSFSLQEKGNVNKKKLTERKKNKTDNHVLLGLSVQHKEKYRTGYKVYELSVCSLNDFFSSAFQRFPFFVAAS